MGKQSVATQDFSQTCLRELIKEGKVELTDNGYQLTERGRAAVMPELRRYEHRPAMAMMIELHVLNQHQHSVW
ncbi:hypothetical protein [Paenibacillus daejeonensis]|uniref:hypothetical protein n=1 Tax=Paenibacillus daejeonensis TaxID=135193 RepID=UPI00037613C4|nr:hypothetical protein [Paenibacillus daejeonensis]